MSADFGAELEAALNGHLAAIREAAAEAKALVDDGLASAAFKAQRPEAPAEAGFSYSDFEGEEFEPEVHTPHGAAVDFDLEEAPLEFDTTVDHDGIPMPEEF
jgi:hypothetical protein